MGRINKYALKFPSMKTPVFVDGNLFLQVPSMKKAVFVDGSENQPGLYIEPLLFIAKFVGEG